LGPAGDCFATLAMTVGPCTGPTLRVHPAIRTGSALIPWMKLE
jgi:hypothetical protein